MYVCGKNSYQLHAIKVVRSRLHDKKEASIGFWARPALVSLADSKHVSKLNLCNNENIFTYGYVCVHIIATSCVGRNICLLLGVALGVSRV